MKRARLAVLAGALLIGGCASEPTIVELPPDHPANPSAAEAPAPPESTTLSLEPEKPRDGPPMHHPEHKGTKSDEPTPNDEEPK